ncbi:TonB-dependent receptor [Exilibacterium tricleocarpae]|uniref:TonB-dependent receptor n=1 Tax=Exilibacterium tricleocarpae TaxID=2591008 RepID=A0A545TSB6_9GAMM|nr:TonB-dependent receptor [Exilibacterium tricleocarpae]TQV80115.1 TonB-dependent receptor [Exilibacterium tricleocarpae]
MKSTKHVTMFLLSTSLLPFAQTSVSQEAIEEVVVTGIRASLEAASELKRADSRVIDAIVAEDIGKLPDNNIAEALQRVTGVSINRNFGVGSEVSIRGLKQNRVEINGRSTMGGGTSDAEGGGRNGVNFEDFPAAFLSRVEVIKSPTPEMVEGALGGTINLVTARPLELNAPLTAVSLLGEYADKSEDWAPILNVSGGRSWDLGDAGTFGAMTMVSYQDRTLRRDESLVQLQVGAVDFNNDGVIDDADNAQNTPSGNYVYGREHTFNPRTENRERTAFNLSLQWAPASEQGQFYLDFNITERSGSQEAFSLLHVGGTPITTPGVTHEDGDGQLQDFELSVLPLQTSASNFRNTDSFSHALGGEWDFTDKLKVSAEFSTSEADTYEPTSEFRFRGIDRALEEANPAASNEWFSLVRFVGSQSGAPTVDFEEGFLLTDQQNQAFRRYEDTRDNAVNEEDAFRLDVEYAEPFGMQWISAVKAGFRSTERDFEQTRRQLRIANIHRDLLDVDGNPDIIWMEDIAAQFPGQIVDYSWGDAFDYSGRNGPYELSRVTAFNVSTLRNQQATFDIVKQLLAGTNLAITGDLNANLAFQEGFFTEINEDTSAFYLQTELDFGSVRAVVGARYVETDITSSAFEQGVIVSDGTTYDDTLPSLNITWDFSENTVLRFAAGKVMRRADFDELSPAFNFQDAFTTATRGNPDLEPFRATQYDISAEHYWGSGNAASVAIFYKDIQSFLKSDSFCADLPDIVATQTNKDDFDKVCVRPEGVGDSPTFTFSSSRAELDAFDAQGRLGVETTTRTNGESGKVQGLEVGYQQMMDFLPGRWSGLGVNLNYTYADSEDPDGVPLEDISKDTFNAQFFYEYQGLGIRLAYTFRDRFLDNFDTKRVRPLGVSVGADPDDPTMGNDYREDLEQWDFSATYDINDNFTVVANITNLTGESTVNTGATGTAFQVLESDRRLTLGLRAKF